jgi:tRNA threonylcarbamoyladenosine biosynthesis protein TsaB
MSRILCFESSTEVCSVAISKDGAVADLLEDRTGQNHSKLLTSFADELLKRNNLNATALDAVAVAQGPGSYTGLRIGVSAAKAICFAMSIPLIAVCPLEAMANYVASTMPQFNFSSDDLFIPMIDARRMEVYTAIFNSKTQPVSEVQALVVDENSFSEKLSNHRCFFFGNGSSKCKGTIAHPNAIFIDEIITSAVNMAPVAYRKFEEKKFVDVAYFEPFYLKDFIATTPRNSVLGK